MSNHQTDADSKLLDKLILEIKEEPGKDVHDVFTIEKVDRVDMTTNNKKPEHFLSATAFCAKKSALQFDSDSKTWKVNNVDSKETSDCCSFNNCIGADDTKFMKKSSDDDNNVFPSEMFDHRYGNINDGKPEKFLSASACCSKTSASNLDYDLKTLEAKMNSEKEKSDFCPLDQSSADKKTSLDTVMKISGKTKMLISKPTASDGVAAVKETPVVDKDKKFNKKKRPHECKLCGKFVFSPKSHIIVHLPETFGIKWLYKCLLCSVFKTLYTTVMNNHLLIHRINGTPVLNKHYVYRTSNIENILNQAMSLTFPEYPQCSPSLAKMKLMDHGECSSNMNKLNMQKSEPCQQFGWADFSGEKTNSVSDCNSNDNSGNKLLQLEQCKLCREKVLQIEYHAHALKHLRAMTGDDWLYKCLLCMDYRTSCSNWQVIQDHIERAHRSDYGLKEGVHFLTHIKQFNGISRSAFPLRTQFDMDFRIQCKLCREKVDQIECRAHVLKHLRSTTGEDWLYKCALCDKFRTSSNVDRLQEHMRKAHKLNELKEDVHYFTQILQFNKINSSAFPLENKSAYSLKAYVTKKQKT